jgi:SNF2 family DNA or RNA helicase
MRMIPAKRRATGTVAPHWRLAGLIKNWTPQLSPAKHIRWDWRLNEPEHAEPEGVALAEPSCLQASSWEIGKAHSFLIGWFDLYEPPNFDDLEPPEESGSDSSPASDPDPEQALHRNLLMRLTAVLQPPLPSLLMPDSVLTWHLPLLGYQQEGILALTAKRELLLADDMGLGKTIQAIAALRLLFFQGTIQRALVVMPASLIRQWRHEFRLWAPELRVVPMVGTASERASLWRLSAHVKLISYETLREDVMGLRDSPALRDEWSVVVLDEASKIKNRETDTARACKRLPRERRWALTGTPLENRLEEVVSILEFLQGDPGERIHLPTTPHAIVGQLRELQLRRKKEQVLTELPPKQIYELFIELPAPQRAAYEVAEREGIVQLQQAGSRVTVTHVLELITRLKQLCNFDPVSQRSAKLEDIKQRVQTLVEEGHRALIFSQFIDSNFGVQRVAEYLKEFRPLLFTGSISQQERATAVQRFLSIPEHKVLILSLRSGGMGLNLQAASYVFHLDRWWNPAIEDQADSRAHRMGQVYPVTVFRYICADTIEERIDTILREKRNLFQEIVDDVSLNLSTALSEEELFGLFHLSKTRE